MAQFFSEKEKSLENDQEESKPQVIDPKNVDDAIKRTII